MKLDKLQKQAGKLATYHPAPIKGLLPALWAAEEAAETMRCFRTAIKNNEELDEEHLKEEMGDTLIALCHLANEMGFSLDDIAEEALDKQETRAEEDEEEKV